MENNNTKSTVDFSKQSEADLLAASQNISQDKFPANYAACMEEIEKRKQNGEWKSQVKIEKTEAEIKSPFSIKLRFISYMLDSIFIYIIAICFFPLSDFLNRLGYWGIVPFYILNIAYWTLFDGTYGKGQTFGKSITNIKVVSTDGSFLSLRRAFVRSLYLPILVGIQFSTYDFFPKSPLSYLFIFGLITFCLFDILCIWQHPQHRSLIDLLSDSIVIHKNFQVNEVVGWKPLLKKKLWFIIGAIYAVLIVCLSVIKEDFLEKQLNVVKKIEESTPLKVDGYELFKSYRDGNLTAQGENYIFSLSPAFASNSESVTEYSKKAREILTSETSSETIGNSKNIIIIGYVFKGLLPVQYTYKNYDLEK